jgi:hypothetical protein
LSRTLLPAVLVVLIVSLPGIGAVAPAQAQEQRLVLAFYYAWYDENTWSPDKVPDMPVVTYRSADRTTIERHVREAKGAGIDALVQSWYGPGTNQTESNFAMLLDEAQKQGLQATVALEVTSPFMPSTGSMIDGLEYLVATHAAHPAFLRYGGKPVILFWRQQHLTVERWADIRSQLDPNRNTVWLAEGYHPEYLAVFDGLHLYNITWVVNTNPEYTASKMRKLIDDYVAEHGGARYWVATAMPGYDDTHVEGRANTYRYPRSPEYYRRTWEAAMASMPEMVIVTSYNEWREGTMIEPSVTYGTTYLDLTRELAAAYKGVEQPTATPAPTHAATSTAVPTATATATPSATATRTPTWTPTDTATPVPTAAATATPSVTATHTAEPTATSTVMPTEAPVETPTATITYKATETHTLVPTATAVVMATHTPAATGTPVSDTTRPPCLGASLLPVAATGCFVTLWRRRDAHHQRE